MGDIEVGTCGVCKKEDQELTRTYYRYNFKCECHSPYHFEFVAHCSDCIPTEPVETKVVLRTDTLYKIKL